MLSNDISSTFKCLLKSFYNILMFPIGKKKTKNNYHPGSVKSGEHGEFYTEE